MESRLLLSEKVRHVGTFDFKATYRILYEWLVGQNYIVDEKEYKEVIGAGGAKEVDVKWEATRKISGYFMFKLTIDYKIIGLTSIEIEENGVKKKINKGDIAITEKCFLVSDYNDQWTGAITKPLKSFYDAYIVRERTEKYEIKIITELEEFVAETKAFLELTGTR